MQKRGIQRGRPAGTTTYDPTIAEAFGHAVRTTRIENEIAQETLANKAGIERSHMGKIERGEHLPTLALIFRIAGALGCSVSTLMQVTELHLEMTQSKDQDSSSK
ncbi:helix-turn-helix transcriptional regulator [Pseudomonas aeruginosa]|uniref:helix-turn-helix domain-containing protein n=1 Tax=Pseudomonas aeruginosa TaxID=287 RepID=UPI002349653D|nr:helix-turn-helix domain-containing protein [Pseudomonas aeruginosa]MDG4084201.1 helix-turn-helix domain-containing protein [Pseudomonas aeruginosa]